MDWTRHSWVLCVFLLHFVIVPHVYGQCLHQIQEELPPDSYLFTISTTSNGNGDPVTFSAAGIPTAQLMNVSESFISGPDEWSANITLKGDLDRDFGDTVRYAFFEGVYGTSPAVTVTISCTIQVRDINDNAPTFQGQPYEIRVPENVTAGAPLLVGIFATDPDNGPNGTVTLSAEFPDIAVNSTFNVTKRNEGQNNIEVQDIYLTGPLDHETRVFYTFKLVAKDAYGTGLTSTATVSVLVQDIQDTPPFFQLHSYRANITEHMHVGTSIIQVSALDGDRGVPNQITYSIVEGNTDFFAINNLTGLITSGVQLDRDNTTMVGTEGAFRLIVRATEIEDKFPQHGNTTTDILVLIMVDDVNDHVPTFGSSSPYTAFVREDIPPNSLIYFGGEGYIFVSDADQGRNAHFSLSVEKDGVTWPVLTATPAEVWSEALVLLRVVDADTIRAAVGTQITFQLVAREISTTERNSRTADIVMAVERVTEQTTTAAPQKADSITAPDVVVFIIGFLVVFNIVVSTLIIWYMRRRSREPKQGLVRHGSKYYVNGTTKKDPAEIVQNDAVVTTLKPETEVVEVDPKDRCDVVPLNERSSFSKSVSAESSQEDVNHNYTKLKTPLILKADGKRRVGITHADVNSAIPTPASLSSTLAKNLSVTINTSTAGSTFVNPVHATDSKVSSTTTTDSLLYVAVPSKSSRATMMTSASSDTGKDSDVSATASPTVTSTSASSMPPTPASLTVSESATLPTATSTTSADAAATSSAAIPVTRFSAKGPVSTSMAVVPGHAFTVGAKVSIENLSAQGRTGSGVTGSSGAAHASTSASGSGPAAVASKGSDLPY